MKNRNILLFIFSFIPFIGKTQIVGFECIDPVDGKGCLPLEVTFRNTSDATNTNSFIWKWGENGPEETFSASQAGETIKHTFYEPGLHEVRLTLIPSSGTPKIEIQIISIYSPDIPQAKLSAQVLCSGQVIFSNTSDPGITPGPRTTYWYFGDGSMVTAGTEDIIHTYSFANDSIYTVKMINENMCGSDSVFSQVTVYHFQNSILSSSGTTLCANQQFMLSNKFHKDYLSYRWHFGDGKSLFTSSPVYEYTLPDMYTVYMVTEIKDGQGCYDSIPLTLNILPGPKSDFSILYDTTCDKADAGFVNTSSGPRDQWNWNFGNGQVSSLENPSGTFHYHSSGNYSIQLISTNTSNGCSDTATKILMVPETPKAGFTADKVCVGDEAHFFDTSLVSFGTINKWKWVFEDGETSSSNTPVKVFQSPGEQIITLIASTDYCSDTTVKSVFVETLPVPSFTLSESFGCSPLHILIRNTSTASVSATWNLGDGYISNLYDSISHRFENFTLHDTVYKIHLTAKTAFGCTDTTSKLLKVYHSPKASFVSDAPKLPVCSPLYVSFQNTSVGYASITWNFGDNTTGKSEKINHIYQNPDHYFKYYRIYLIAHSDNNCNDTSETSFITVYPRPRTNFVIDSPNLCLPATAGFFAPPEANAHYTWIFGDNNSIRTTNYNISHFYSLQPSKDTTIYIKLITESEFGCADSTTKTLVLHTTPEAQFSFSPPSPMNYPAVVSFTNLSVNNVVFKYYWSFGDKNIPDSKLYSPGIINYSSWGYFPVKLKITNQYNCSDSALDTVYVLAPPAKLDFTMDTSAGCPPLRVSFTNLSVNVDTNSYFWRFGDGSVSYASNPTHTYYDQGNITVTLSASDFSGNYLSKDTNITIYNKPSANFEVIPQIIVVPDEPVSCKPLYQNTDYSYLWDFGDFSTSTEITPIHYYTMSADYTITLMVTSPENCADTVTKTAILKAKAGGKLKYPNAFIPRLGGSGGGTGGLDLGNGVFYPPIEEGVIEYYLEIYDRWGERLFNSDVKDLGWDGYYKNKLCKQDVYIWKASGIYSDGRPFVLTGTVTLIHDSRNQR